MRKVYALFEGNRILKMSTNKREIIEFRASFPEVERKGMLVAEQITLGPEANPRPAWGFEIPQDA